VEVCTARTVRRTIVDAEPAALATVLKKYLPSSVGTFRQAQTCLYTNAPDRDFIVGIHPQHANVVFGSWCGGHGFKFGSVSGKVHADLVTDGRTDLPITFLSADRFKSATISG
jgi:sarcosine oxidase